MSCEVVPVSAFASTNVNNRIKTFDDLGMRIIRNLGAPITVVECSKDQIYDCIAQACEMYAKFAGYTRETLIFDSALYERDRGIKLDTLFTIGTPGRQKDDLIRRAQYIQDSTVKYASAIDIPYSDISGNQYLSGALSAGIFRGQIIEVRPFVVPSAELLQTHAVSGGGTFIIQINDTQKVIPLYNDDFVETVGLTSPVVSAWLSTPVSAQIGTPPFHKSTPTTQNVRLIPTATPAEQSMRLFDYDLMDYRKVMSVTGFEKGSLSTFGATFSLEASLAQQTYFQFMAGGYGFDLLSWWTMKNWMETREKVLGTRPQWQFDENTQYLTLWPQPRPDVRFYGVVECCVEKPIKDLIKEQWVQKYATAKVMCAIGWSRSKYTSMSMFGGGTISNDILAKGLEQCEKLEQQLYEGAAPGLGSTDPILFMIG